MSPPWLMRSQERGVRRVPSVRLAASRPVLQRAVVLDADGTCGPVGTPRSARGPARRAPAALPAAGLQSRSSQCLSSAWLWSCRELGFSIRIWCTCSSVKPSSLASSRREDVTPWTC